MLTNASLMDPMPDLELMGNALYLGRPELTMLMSRYSSSKPRVKSLFKPPTALIVSRRAGEEAPLKESLENEGWFVKTCAGPGAGSCPVMRGEACDLRKAADAAVVFVDAGEVTSGLGAVHRLRCAADSASPGVVALEDSFEAPCYLGRSATVGSLRGPKAILEAITHLLETRKGR